MYIYIYIESKYFLLPKGNDQVFSRCRLCHLWHVFAQYLRLSDLGARQALRTCRDRVWVPRWFPQKSVSQVINQTTNGLGVPLLCRRRWVKTSQTTSMARVGSVIVPTTQIQSR